MRVEAEIIETELMGEIGLKAHPGVKAFCTRCDNTSIGMGRSDRSRRRCLVLLSETCPNDENNFYVEE